jgi:hypothetical protein
VITVQGIKIDSKDVSWLGEDLFCRTPESLELALTTLREKGYRVKDLRIDGYGIREGNTTPEEMEIAGDALWFADANARMGKCGSCQELINTRGIERHGHKCEKCGEVTYYQLPKGATVQFEFNGDSRRIFSPQLLMRVIHWDLDNGWLYLEPEVLKRNSTITVYGDKAVEYLNQHLDQWEMTEYEGQPAMKVRYYGSGTDKYADNEIHLHDDFGDYRNFKIVRVWEGKEYPEYGKDFPVPDSVHIYELWHRAETRNSYI